MRTPLASCSWGSFTPLPPVLPGMPGRTQRSHLGRFVIVHRCATIVLENRERSEGQPLRFEYSVRSATPHRGAQVGRRLLRLLDQALAAALVT